MELNSWGVALLALMFVLLFVELFLPTAGVLGAVAAIVGIAGLVCLFMHDLSWGLSGLLAVVVLVPAFAAFAFRVWPSTPMGRRIIGAPTDEEVEAGRLAELKEKARVAGLVGREGVALTALRPVGVVEVDGQRFDALAEITFVPAGTKVRITHADASQIKVREAK
ncbi:MAG: NfeD family protein [Phycisphaerae bacterium]|jgi:membrane-bound serine protease (ClpP class)